MAATANLEQVGAALGGQTILRDLTLEVLPGEVVGVVGPNGSGKTTLLRLLATLVTPSSGAGWVLDAQLGSAEVYPVRHHIGLLSHIPAVIGELSLRENLEHAIRLAGEDPGRIDTALRVVGLDDAADRQGEASSFGMLRRIEVARLLITRPRFLLLDEAFSGLDSDAQDLIDALITRTDAAGGATVIVSHDPSQFHGRATRVMALEGGRLQVPA